MLQNIIELLNKQKIKPNNILFCGSRNNKYASTNHNSDFDFLILTNQVVESKIINIKKKNIDYELILISYSNIYNILIDELLNRKKTYWSMIAQGTIIKDSNNILKSIRREFAIIIEQVTKNTIVSNFSLNKIINDTKKVTNKLSNAHNNVEAAIVASTLFLKITRLIVCSKQYVCEEESKYLYNDLKQINEQYEILDLYKKSLISNAFNEMINYSLEKIKLIQNLKDQKTKHIPKNHSIFNITCYRINIGKIEAMYNSTVKNVLNTNKAIVFYNEDSKFIDPGLYIILHAAIEEKNIILNTLSKALNQFKVNTSNRYDHFFYYYIKSKYDFKIQYSLLNNLSRLYLKEFFTGNRNVKYNYAVFIILFYSIRTLNLSKTIILFDLITNPDSRTKHHDDSAQTVLHSLYNTFYKAIKYWCIKRLPKSQITNTLNTLIENQNCNDITKQKNDMWSTYTNINQALNILLLTHKQKQGIYNIVLNLLINVSKNKVSISQSN